MNAVEPERVAALLSAAATRLVSLRTTVVHRADPDRLAAAWRRAFPTSPDAVGTPGEPYEASVRTWLVPPDLAREERADGSVYVQAGGRWAARVPGRPERAGPVDPDVGPFVARDVRSWADPGPLAEALVLAGGEPDVAAGRPVLRVQARASVAGDDPALEPLGWGADAYELVVDAERGVLLGTAAMLEGAAFRRSWATAVAYDESFADALFVLEETA